LSHETVDASRLEVAFLSAVRTGWTTNNITTESRGRPVDGLVPQLRRRESASLSVGKRG
jgi:hypothetical protein